MRHLILLGLALVSVACGDKGPTGPPPPPTEIPFSVSIAVNTMLSSIGCVITWSAKASDSLVLVDYSLWIFRNRAGHAATFRNSVKSIWVFSPRTTVPVDWVLSAGTWSDSGGVEVKDCTA